MIKTKLMEFAEEFGNRNIMRVIGDELYIKMKHELNRKFHEILEGRNMNLVKFHIDHQNDGRFQVIAENLFTLYLITMFELPPYMFMPENGDCKNEEKFYWNDYEFWFSENKPCFFSKNLNASEKIINKYNL